MAAAMEIKSKGENTMTELGKFLRKLRIDNDEIMLDMANKLGVSSSHLSAVETGKRLVPLEWTVKICEIYNLDDVQKAELERLTKRGD